MQESFVNRRVFIVINLVNLVGYEISGSRIFLKQKKLNIPFINNWMEIRNLCDILVIHVKLFHVVLKDIIQPMRKKNN